jgi:hypothetical protein
MDNPKGRDFPQTVEEAVALMTGVWSQALTNSPPGPPTSSNSRTQLSSNQPPHSGDRHHRKKKRGKLAVKGEWENVVLVCHNRNHPHGSPSDTITLTLDSGANVNIIDTSIKDSLSNLVPCDEEITGVGGHSSRTTERGESRWGPTYVVEGSDLNLISLSELRKVAKVSMSDEDDVFRVTFPNGSTHEFKVDESGLYHCEVPVSDFGLTANVHVSAEQKKRAKMVKEPHVLLNHPSFLGHDPTT